MSTARLIKGMSVGAALIATSIFGGIASAETVTSLRGAQIDEPVSISGPARQTSDRVNREYRQQPPLVPHEVSQYQVDLKVNQCLNCHDWSKAGERKAPTLSMTHYADREGRQLDEVAGTRWFCTQCHVPQHNAEPLVANEFTPSSKR